MSPSELTDWQNLVNDYIVNIHPSLTAISAWADMPQSFYDGCELAMCIIRAREFAKRPQQYKPQQAVRILCSHLTDALNASGYVSSSQAVDKQQTKRGPGRPRKDGAPNATTQSSPNGAARFGRAENDATPSTQQHVAEDKDRGEHLSEYMYMLNEATKKKAERLQSLYLQQADLAQSSEALAKTYEDAERKGDTALMDITAKSAAPFNRELVQVNQDIRDFWADVDECVAYYKKNAKVMPEPTPSCDTSQDLTMSEVAAAHAGTTDGGVPVGKKPAECTKAEIDQIQDPTTKHLYEKARMDADKKYLRRTDVSHTDEWRAQVRLRVQELIAWDVKLSKRTHEVMELAGCADL